MITVRAFLMLHEGSGDWTVQVHKDLGSIEAEWTARLTANSSSVAVLHVGFSRPMTEQFEAFVQNEPGRILVTDAARYALPLGHTTIGRRIGSVDEMSLYVAASGWGYTEDEPVATGIASHLPADSLTDEHLFYREYKAKPDWVSGLVYKDEDLLERAIACGVDNESLYLQQEALLPDSLREALGWERYLYYVGLLPDAGSLLRTLRFAPLWLLKRPIPSLELSVRATNALAAAGVETVYDLAVLGAEGLSSVNNLGTKTVREIGTEILSVFVGGPWLRRSAEADQVIARRKSDVHLPEIAGSRLRTGVQRKHARAAQLVPTLPRPPEYLNINELLLNCVDWADEKHRDVLRRRMGFDGRVATLDEIGVQRRITRERVRQIESKAISKLRASSIWSEEVERRLSEILSATTFPVPLEGLEVLDPWFAGAGELRLPLSFALRNFCSGAFSIVDIDGQQIVTRLSPSDWASAQGKAKEIVSGFAGKGILESDVRAAIDGLLAANASELRSALWEESTRHAHFADVPGGRELVSVGFGVDHAVKAVLRESRTPLHYLEIQERCEKRLGRKLEERRVHNAAASVGLLYGRGTYGLEGHLPLSEAECQSIVEAAEDVLASGPGERQWHANEIVEALSEQDLDLSCELDPYLLSIALARSSEVASLGRMMWTTQGAGAKGSAHRIDVRQAVISLLQTEGRPLSAGEIRDRLSAERGLNKYFQIPQGESLIRVASGKWGLIERDVPFSPEERSELERLLHEALIARGKALHVSEIEGVLKHSISLSADVDPMLIADLVQRNRVMSLARGGLLFLAEWGDPRRPTLQQAVKDLFLSCGEHGLTMDEIHEELERLVERPLVRASLPSCCDDVADFSPATNRWSPRQGEFTSF